MRICVWKTGHQIADTVADALAEGFNADVFQANDINSVEIAAYDAHIGYGILRGSSEAFSRCEKLGMPWFNMDKGYFKPGHFDGYYRISNKGTQALYDDTFLVGDLTVPPIQLEERANGSTHGKHVMLCPPTMEVCRFFDLHSPLAWTAWAIMHVRNMNKWPYEVREKGDPSPINWDDVAMIITFNSSVGWEAVRRGIPCLSDVKHSTVGSFYGETVADLLLEKFYTLDRMKLFNFMQAHQFTLDEIAQGKAKWLIEYYLSRSSSDGIAGKPSPPTSLPIRFAGAQGKS